MQPSLSKRVGRPPDSERDEIPRQIVECATVLFLAQGYGATSLDQIAAAAGVGKNTIYRHFDTKAGLLQHVIRKRTRTLIAVATQPAMGLDALQQLRRFARSMCHASVNPGNVELARLIVSESGRMPGLGEVFVAETNTHLLEETLRLFEQAQREGTLGAHDSRAAATTLVSMCWGMPQFALLVDHPHFKDHAQLDAYFEEKWRIFLCAYHENSVITKQK